VRLAAKIAPWPAENGRAIGFGIGMAPKEAEPRRLRTMNNDHFPVLHGGDQVILDALPPKAVRLILLIIGWLYESEALWDVK
jgi:hypothetical protein